MAGRNSRAEKLEQHGSGIVTGLLGIDALDPRSAELRLYTLLTDVARLWPLLMIAQLCGTAVVQSVGAHDGIIDRLATPAAWILLGASAVIMALGQFAKLRLVWTGHLVFVQIIAMIVSASAYALILNHIAPPDSTYAVVTNVSVQLIVAMIAVSIVSACRLAILSYAAAVIATDSFLLPWSLVLAGQLTFLAILTIVMTIAGAYQRRNKEQQASAVDNGSERAAALLHDFEQSGYGWFWETDRQGRLTYISASVAEALHCSVDALIGQSLSQIVLSDLDEGGSDNRTLGFHMSARSAFTELAVQARQDGEGELWWSVSGNPVVNHLGHFMGFRGIGTDLTAMKRSQQENTQLARYDTLTGLANRLHIKQLLEKALVSISGHSQPCALFMLDLDRFKQVNDTLGHPVGDLLLQQVGRRLQRTIGDLGQVGRLGGDEFQVVLPLMTDQSKLGELARAVIISLSKPYSLNNHQVIIGASVGISIHDDGPADSAALIRNADLALYAAKAAGRGIYRFYESEMHRHATERQQIEAELRTALAAGQFELEYQPVVDVSTEKISGFEALLRWNHPRFGRYSPANFIPIAEDAGLIVGIGEWAIRTACEHAARWPTKARVAVNVSPAQFGDPSFITSLIYALSSSGLEPQRLELEVTEGLFLNESPQTTKIFHQIKKLGVRLALDDFGTGYSALGYLKKAPFDKIKIDQSFVRGAVKPGSINSAIITSIVSLAESLNMETTAEGAETQDELMLVRALGCSHIQGYIYGKPMPAAQVRTLLTRQNGFAVAIGFARSREPRQRMIRKAALYHNDYCYEGRIRNLSAQGALIEGLWDVPEGTQFTVQLARDITVQAVTRWSSENRIGLQFIQLVDVEKLAKAPRLDVREGPLHAEQRKAS